MLNVLSLPRNVMVDITVTDITQDFVVTASMYFGIVVFSVSLAALWVGWTTEEHRLCDALWQSESTEH